MKKICTECGAWNMGQGACSIRQGAWSMVFFLSFVFCLLSLNLFGQKDLFGTNPTSVRVSNTNPGGSQTLTLYNSDPFTIRKELRDIHEKPWALFGLTLNVDTLVAGADTAANGTWEEDSILYFIVYDPADHDPIVGDTIQWKTFGDTTTVTTKWIKPHVHNTVEWFWKNDPTADNIYGFPLTKMPMYVRRVVVGDSSNFRESLNLYVQ